MTLRIGILGLGKMGRNHARVLSAIEDVQLIGFYDPSPRAELYGVKSHENPESLFESIDAAIIASPTTNHLESAGLAAKYGKSALIEKPLARSVTEARQIVESFSKSKAEAVVGMVERFNPAILLTREIVESGEIGEIHQISTHREGPFSGRISDVGVGLDLAVHDLDLIRWMNNESIIQYSSFQERLPESCHEDFFVASGTLESGAIFQTSANWRSPIKRREVKIYGAKGTLNVDLLDMSVRLDRPGNVNVIWDEQKRLSGNSVGDSIVFGVQKNEPLMAELGQFAEFVKSGYRGQLCSLEDAKSLIKLLEIS